MANKASESVQIRDEDWEVFGQLAEEAGSNRTEIVTAIRLALQKVWARDRIQLLAAALAPKHTESQTIRAEDAAVFAALANESGSSRPQVVAAALLAFRKLRQSEQTQLLVSARSLYPMDKPRQGRGNRRLPAQAG
jgi:hypothetical protein